jgi:hypothetical protein
MIFELDGTRVGDWDRFQIRKVGFKAQRELTAEQQQALERIVKDKASSEEVKDLKWMQKDERLRRVIIKLGS